MVHRIQNRNPCYSDFGTSNATASFSFSNNISSPVTQGANALKLEDEINSENINDSNFEKDVNQINNQYHEELLKNQQAENIVENTHQDQENSFTQEATETETMEEDTNDLKEFGVDTEAPDLFNSDQEFSNPNDLLSSDTTDEDDDLEIPAFLRRQKN